MKIKLKSDRSRNSNKNNFEMLKNLKLKMPKMETMQTDMKTRH